LRHAESHCLASKDLMPVGIPAFANYRRTGVSGGGGKLIREHTAKVAVPSNGHFLALF